MLQFVGCGAHRLRGGIHIRDETVELLICLRKFAALHTLGERTRLIGKFRLNLGKKLRGFGGLQLRSGLIALLLPGGRDDFLFALRNIVGILLLAAASSATTARICCD